MAIGNGNTTVNPGFTLDVQGNVYVTGSVTTGSDYRLKNNVKDLDETFVVDNLKPVHYDMNERHDMGFIAHELQEIFPFLVSGEKDGEKMQSVNYNGLIALLVKEIKDIKGKLKKHGIE